MIDLKINKTKKKKKLIFLLRKNAYSNKCSYLNLSIHQIILENTKI